MTDKNIAHLSQAEKAAQEISDLLLGAHGYAAHDKRRIDLAYAKIEDVTVHLQFVHSIIVQMAKELRQRYPNSPWITEYAHRLETIVMEKRP